MLTSNFRSQLFKAARRRALHSCCSLRNNDARPAEKLEQAEVGAKPSVDVDAFSFDDSLPIDTARPTGTHFPRRHLQPFVQNKHFPDGYLVPEHLQWLRDICDCPRCVDPSTRQKRFQMCDIPRSIKGKMVGNNGDELKVLWENEQSPSGEDHISTYSKQLLHHYGSRQIYHTPIEGFGPSSKRVIPYHWNRAKMERDVSFHNVEEYMKSDTELFEVLKKLRTHGLVFLKGVPPDEESVARIANRIGHIQETFYGRTWDVKAVAESKNVAYTSQYLGFHMDLLYRSDPPGLQFLHCIKNSCEGGSSMFADSFLATQTFRRRRDENQDWVYDVLCKYPQTFHYDNAGEHYRQTRPVIVEDPNGKTMFVNWSPPFQAPTKYTECEDIKFSSFVAASKQFGDFVQYPGNIYEYKMEEGDCVIFNNRRTLHARREFDAAGGERWLKGTYVDTDVFNSRFRGLYKKMMK